MVLERLILKLFNKAGFRGVIIDEKKAQDDSDICLLYHPVQYGTTGRDVRRGDNLYKCKVCYDPYNVEGVCQGYHRRKKK